MQPHDPIYAQPQYHRQIHEGTGKNQQIPVQLDFLGEFSRFFGSKGLLHWNEGTKYYWRDLGLYDTDIHEMQSYLNYQHKKQVPGARLFAPAPYINSPEQARISASLLANFKESHYVDVRPRRLYLV